MEDDAFGLPCTAKLASDSVLLNYIVFGLLVVVKPYGKSIKSPANCHNENVVRLCDHYKNGYE